MSLTTANQAILSGPFHRKLYIIVLSCFINSSGVGKTENTYVIFESKKDLIIVILQSSERPLQRHSHICSRISFNLS